MLAYVLKRRVLTQGDLTYSRAWPVGKTVIEFVATVDLGQAGKLYLAEAVAAGAQVGFSQRSNRLSKKSTI